MARPLLWLALVLLAGSTGESYAGIVLVRNESFLMVPGDSAYLFDGTHYNSLIPSGTWAFDSDAAQYSAQITPPYDVQTRVGIQAHTAQTFSLQSDTIVGQGSAGATSDYLGQVGTTPFEAHSTLDVTFEVTERSWFVLNGTALDRVGGVVNPPGASIHSFTSLQGPSPILVVEDTPYEFFRAGLLEPGVQYRLFFSSSEVPLSGLDDTRWSFTLTVPEPPLSLGLAGLLALGLVLRRSR